MTENEKLVRDETEAIECLKSNKPTSGYLMLQESIDMAIKALEEVQQYRAIGTPEECRAAVEKQTAKKIEIFNGQASCPNCKHLFGGMDVIKSLIAWNMPCCTECGQHIDWRDEE